MSDNHFERWSEKLGKYGIENQEPEQIWNAALDAALSEIDILVNKLKYEDNTICMGVIMCGDKIQSLKIV